MKSSHFLISLFAALFCAAMQTQQSEAQETAIASTNEETILRDPFWPPSYNPEPTAPLAQVEPVKPATNQPGTVIAPVAPKETKWPVLKVKGVIKDAKGRYIAQIEGIGLAESGQTVRMKKDGVFYYWKVGEVTERGVEIKPFETRPAK